MRDIRMIATDLDGTVLGKTRKFFEYQEFDETVADFRKRHDAIWVICTGRSRKGFRRRFESVMGLGIRPDYVITSDRYIYTLTRRKRFVPHLSWNLAIRRKVKDFRRNTSALFSEWYDFFTSWDFGIVRSARSKQRLSFVFDSPESADRAQKMMEEKIAGHEYVRVVRQGLQVFMVVEMFTKALAVAELTRTLGLTPLQVLAIGDGSNDLNMMNSSVAAQTGCPANARSQVIEAVHKAGGHIAREAYLAGVVEILRAYDGGTVCSDIPETWRPQQLKRVVESSWRPASRQKQLIIAAAFAVAALVLFVGGLFLLMR